jgi:hypothetical protein
MRKILASMLGTALAIGSVHATDLKGTVLLPNGKPAAGAEVGAFISGKPLSVRLHMLQDPVNQDRVIRANDQGNFSFSPAGEATEVYATHELGYAKVTVAALAAASNQIVLQSWGRLEGTLTVGGQPKSDWWIQVDGGTPVEPILRDITTFGVRTDAAGRFILNNVPPGQWYVGRYVSSRQCGPIDLTPTAGHFMGGVLPGFTESSLGHWPLQGSIAKAKPGIYSQSIA